MSDSRERQRAFLARYRKIQERARTSPLPPGSFNAEDGVDNWPETELYLDLVIQDRLAGLVGPEGQPLIRPMLDNIAGYLFYGNLPEDLEDLPDG